MMGDHVGTVGTSTSVKGYITPILLTGSNSPRALYVKSVPILVSRPRMVVAAPIVIPDMDRGIGSNPCLLAGQINR